MYQKYDANHLHLMEDATVEMVCTVRVFHKTSLIFSLINGPTDSQRQCCIGTEKIVLANLRTF